MSSLGMVSADGRHEVVELVGDYAVVLVYGAFFSSYSVYKKTDKGPLGSEAYDRVNEQAIAFTSVESAKAFIGSLEEDDDEA